MGNVSLLPCEAGRMKTRRHPVMDEIHGLGTILILSFDSRERIHRGGGTDGMPE